MPVFFCVPLKQNNDEAYVYLIKPTHTLKKRDVYSIDTVSVPTGVQPKDETIIIVPNSGVNNYPYNNYYDPRNPVPHVPPLNDWETIAYNRSQLLRACKEHEHVTAVKL
ncbi:jg7410 [Pararge aegeria aegeria]|uniref:Jg7410 protein n=1 Tax=Pararge aegeria aegeria TaxID=348720 RepID=A0A8S4RSS3_9NEOP|nr:jg7410 [Pararge aegeria aegeria]